MGPTYAPVPVRETSTPIVARNDDPKVSLYFLGLIAVSATSIALPWAWTIPTLFDTVGLVALGTLSAAGQRMMVRALDCAPVSSIVPLFYLHFLWALLYGKMFFDEMPDWVSVGGVTLVVVSVLLVYWQQASGRN
jgi:drug/metabolite transporter (DMT)-like permease